MGKHKEGKKNKKGSQLVIRIDKAERDAFISLCDAVDTSAAREIRRFMREWVAANTPTPASDREEVAGPASYSKTASAEMPPVQLEETVMEAAEHAIVAAPEKVDAKEPKVSRKAPKR